MAVKIFFQFSGFPELRLHTAESGQDTLGKRLIDLVGCAGVSAKVAHIRYRPTGESGDGPYFSSYNGGRDGVTSGLCSPTVIYAGVAHGYHEAGSDDAAIHAAHNHYWWDATPGHIRVFKYERMNRKIYSVAERVVATYIEYDPNSLILRGANQYWVKMRCQRYAYSCPWGKEKGLSYHKAEFSKLVAMCCEKPLSTQLVSSLTGLSEYRGSEHFDFKYSERDAFTWITDFDLYPPKYASLASAAYVEACDQLPETQINSIANVLELASSINNLRKGKLIPTNVRDAWLAYRYAYCTTKSDIAEYKELTSRLIQLTDTSVITSRGQCVGGGLVCKCTIVCSAASIIPSNLQQWLKTYGFRMTAANAWDMVPYSFVVDWFLHISDFLEYFEKLGNALELPVQEVWYSFSSEYEHQSTYFRVPGKRLFALPYVSYHQTSKTTIFKRILDSIALFT